MYYVCTKTTQYGPMEKDAAENLQEWLNDNDDNDGLIHCIIVEAPSK